MRGRRMPWAAVFAVVLLVGLTAGCARDQGTAVPPASSATPSASAGARQDVQQDTRQDMERKVAAAESALTAADRDAAQDGGH
ncbi:hypothetical protein ABZ876_00280 [Streptomyces sp. NPDC046931]|uniref:hypothetical protein n=1 Tax=Streptomyces sp. NPDC046931 TaxID=3154806 RepID=UPI0033E382C0